MVILAQDWCVITWDFTGNVKFSSLVLVFWDNSAEESAASKEIP